MERLSTTSLAGQNISSALLVKTYTADADRELLIQVMLSGLSGGGTYKACLTKQAGGVGAIYQSPTALVGVASTMTTAFIPTTSLAVTTGDVVKVYVQGKTADNSVAVVIEIFDTLSTIQSALTTIDSIADKLDSAMVADGGVYQFTANALELAPSPTIDPLLAYMGAIWFDANASNTNTVVGVDGTPNNPVSTTAAMLALIASTGFTIVRIKGILYLDSTVNLTFITFMSWNGGEYDEFCSVYNNNDLDIGLTDNCSFFGIQVLVPVSGSNGYSFLNNCYVRNSIAYMDMKNSTYSAATIYVGNYVWADSCHTEYGTAIFDLLNMTDGETNIFWKHSGTFTFLNLATGRTIDLELDGKLVLDASCTGGTINLYGICELVDNSNGAVTINDYRTVLTAPVDLSSVIGGDGDTLESLSDQIDAVAIPGSQMDLLPATLEAIISAMPAGITLGDIEGSTIIAKEETSQSILEALSSLDVSDSVLSSIVEGTLTIQDVLKVMLAVLAGVSDGSGQEEVNFRDQADSINRITFTLDRRGNRTGVSVNVS